MSALTVDVIVPVPVDEAFTYRVPEGFENRAQVGVRAVVPFGSRTVTGLIVGRSEQDAGGHRGRHEEGAAEGENGRTLKPLESIVDDEPAFTDELIGLTRWIAEYYLCSWGEAVRAALPPGTGRSDVSVRTDVFLRLAESYRNEEAIRDVLEELPGHKQEAVVEVLADRLAEGTEEIPQVEVLEEADASYSTVRSLLRREVIERVEREVVRTPYGSLADRPPEPEEHELMEAQADALEAVLGAIEGERFESFLLHGVTGSGKTEVYIRALREVRRRGETGIVLVPEIALTPQTVNRFRAHFGDEVAVLHSQMSDGERYDTWREVRRGRYSIVIGPRSAVLAPLENLGLIVVDEEHEESYKQFDPAPRYHARDVAVMRAHRNEAVCLLGSATPSLESYLNARHGKYTLLELPDRIPGPDGEPVVLPEVEVVDLTLERRKHRLEGALSETLRAAIGERLERQEQVILLQNRRGYAPVVECADCGWSPECRDCAVTMTYHKSRRQLRCHYCGLAGRKPESCPECGGTELGLHGQGTQRVEEELRELFPEAALERMDRDTTSAKDAHRTILERFERGETDVLLGTQMIAKGLDFGGVTLVGVVNADTGMLFPDFRAEERTFQLLTQVAGRSGRSDLPGEVYFQTRNPDHPAIRFAREHDYHGFVESELPQRRQFGYPPYGRMVGVEFRGKSARRVESVAEDWTRILKERVEEGRVQGPSEAFVGKVKGKYRFHTLVRIPRKVPSGRIRDWFRGTEEAYGSVPGECRVAIDVDPVGRF